VKCVEYKQARRAGEAAMEPVRPMPPPRRAVLAEDITVEALADMTPEQLEAIEGIGPKTVEKISLAVNNYFASLEQGEAGVAEGELPAEGVAAEGEAVPEEATAEATAEAAAEEAAGEVAAESERAALAEATSEAEAAPENPASNENKNNDEEHGPKAGSAPETTE